MALIGVLVQFTPLTTIKSADVNANLSAIQTAFNNTAVLTDVARTVAVSHTFTPAQTFTGGLSSGAAILFSSDNTADLGASGANRPRNVYVAGNGTFGGALAISGNTTLNGAVVVGGGIVWASDNTADIGAAASSRPRNVYVAGAGTFGGALAVTGDARFGGQLIAGAFAGTAHSPGDVVARRSATTGAYYFGDGAQTYLFFDGASFVFGPNGASANVSLNGGLTFPTDNTYDIGASGASRPRNVWVGSGINAGTSITASGGFFSGGDIKFSSDNTNNIGAAAANRPANIYCAGTVFAASSRALKEQIRPTRVDALALIRGTRIVDFRYKANPSRPKVGFIAEDTDELLSGPVHKDFDLNNAIGLLLRAVQQLEGELATLKAAA